MAVGGVAQIYELGSGPFLLGLVAFLFLRFLFAFGVLFGLHAHGYVNLTVVVAVFYHFASGEEYGVAVGGGRCFTFVGVGVDYLLTIVYQLQLHPVALAVLGLVVDRRESLASPFILAGVFISDTRRGECYGVGVVAHKVEHPVVVFGVPLRHRVYDVAGAFSVHLGDEFQRLFAFGAVLVAGH